MKNAKKIIGEVKAYLLITFGLLFYVLGWDIFLLPNSMVGGGVTGVSAILFYAFKIPVSISFFVINLILLAIALKVLGKGFGIKTVYAILITSLMFQIVPNFISDTFIHEIAISNGKLLCAIFGGVASGLGIGVCFSQGGSTGGTDIIALMITKYRNVSPGKVILLMDIFIIASSLLIPSSQNIGERMAIILYGYILIGASSYTLDLYISGTKQSLQVFIFSKKYNEIADAVIKGVGRGVSVFNATGWYTKNDNKVLMIILRKTDMPIIYKTVKEIDKDAFMSVGSVTGVYGKGFDQIKK